MYRTKKLLAVLVAVILAIGLLPCMSASAELTYWEFEYEVSSKKATITGYVGDGYYVAIPSSIDGYSVTTIGEYAFQGSSIYGISIPSSVTKIEKYAFIDCYYLEIAYIPSNVTTIGTGVFNGCDNLTIYAPSSSTAYKYAGNNSIDRKSGTASTTTVRFNANGGSVSPSSKTVTKDFDYGELPVPTRTNYVFDGWNTSSDGSGDYITSTSIVEKSSSHTLYAQWNQYSTTAPTVTTDAVENLTSNSVDLSGTIKSVGGAAISAFGWEVENLTEGKASRLGVKSDEFSAGTTFSYTYTSLVSGYSYRYRTYATNLYGTSYGEWVSFTAPASGAAYIVTFDVNGGNSLSADKRTKTVYYGSSYGELPVPTRSGYTFAGWYTSSRDGDGSLVTAETKVNRTTNHTLYAHWTEGAAPVEVATSRYELLGQDANSRYNVALYGALTAGSSSDVTGYGFYLRRVSTGGETQVEATAMGSDLSFTRTVAIGVATADEEYQFRAYAITSAGTIYGEWISFVPSGSASADTVEVTTGRYELLGQDANSRYNVALYGALTAGSSSDVTGYGFWLRRVSTGGETQVEVTAMGSDLSFTRTVAIGVATADEEYQFRAYAITSAGTIYGEWVSFIPSSNTPANTVEVTTGKYELLGQDANSRYNVALYGAITAGSSDVTGYGFWLRRVSTGGETQVEGTNMGSDLTFSRTIAIGAATADEEYQYRAYAVTSAGTVYGEWASFIPNNSSAPESQRDYTVNSITVGDAPSAAGTFYAEATVTKNTDRAAKDTVVIAAYKDGMLVDMTYMKAELAQGQTVTFGGRLTADADCTLKAFVWDSLEGMQSLSNSLEAGGVAQLESVDDDVVIINERDWILPSVGISDDVVEIEL